MTAKRTKKSKKYEVHRTLPHSKYTAGSRPVNEAILESDIEKTEKPKSRLTWKKAVISLFLFLFTLILIVGIWDAVNFSRAANKMFGSGNLINLVSSSDLKTDDKGRVNVLTVGYSIDDPGHPGANLTDSIMLINMNPSSDSGYMLSIPRDLYVRIPGFGSGKINEAYTRGGIELLKQIVEEVFGIKVGYYVLANYASVRDTVNALDGITINIKSPDPRGLYDPNISPIDGGPLKLSNGTHQLDGQTALNLTRSRGDGVGSYGFPQSDFNRTEHQRQIFVATKEKAFNWKLVLNPRKNGQLFDAVASNIKTDIELGEVRPLYGLFRSIPNSSLRSISLNQINGRNLLRSYATPTGQSALIPAAGLNNYTQIQETLQLL